MALPIALPSDQLQLPSCSAAEYAKERNTVLKCIAALGVEAIKAYLSLQAAANFCVVYLYIFLM